MEWDAARIPAAETLRAGAAARMRRRWGLEGGGCLFSKREGDAESASCTPTLGDGMAGSPKQLGVPSILGSAFSNPAAGQGCWPRTLPAPEYRELSTRLA